MNVIGRTSFLKAFEISYCFLCSPFRNFSSLVWVLVVSQICFHCNCTFSWCHVQSETKVYLIFHVFPSLMVCPSLFSLTLWPEKPTQPPSYLKGWPQEPGSEEIGWNIRWTYSVSTRATDQWHISIHINLIVSVWMFCH